MASTFRYDYVNPLAFVQGFGSHMIQYCAMHTLHLGVLHHVNGGALLCLMAYDFFGAQAKTLAQMMCELIPR